MHTFLLLIGIVNDMYFVFGPNHGPSAQLTESIYIFLRTAFQFDVPVQI